MIGALLGTQKGRDYDIVNSYELICTEGNEPILDKAFFVSRQEQCKYHWSTDHDDIMGIDYLNLMLIMVLT